MRKTRVKVNGCTCSFKIFHLENILPGIGVIPMRHTNVPIYHNYCSTARSETSSWLHELCTVLCDGQLTKTVFGRWTYADTDVINLLPSTCASFTKQQSERQERRLLSTVFDGLNQQFLEWNECATKLALRLTLETQRCTVDAVSNVGGCCHSLPFKDMP